VRTDFMNFFYHKDDKDENMEEEAKAKNLKTCFL